MKQQDILSATEIKDGMTVTPWQKVDISVSNDNTWFDHLYDQKATLIAVNSTYGKGLNPEAFEDVVKALEYVLKEETALVGIEKGMLREALKNAKI